MNPPEQAELKLEVDDLLTGLTKENVSHMIWPPKD